MNNFIVAGLILYELYCTKKEQLLRKISASKEESFVLQSYQETSDNLGNIIKEVINILTDDIAAPDDISSIDLKQEADTLR